MRIAVIAAGANVKVVQRITGHPSITMTIDRSGHLMPGGLAEAAARVDAYLERVTVEEDASGSAR